MAFDLTNFQDETLDADYLAFLVDQQSVDNARHFGRLWDYFRNPLSPAAAVGSSSRPYVQAQEAGLPSRITGVQGSTGNQPVTDIRRKEIVIENDIAWRIHTMVDYLFGRAVTIRSKARDAHVAHAIEAVVAAMLDANGGVRFLQEAALLGSVHGFVDIALRTPAEGAAILPPSSLASANASRSRPATSRPDTSHIPAGVAGAAAAGQYPDGTRSNSIMQRAIRYARLFTFETIEAPRVLPVLQEDDYHRLSYWTQRFHKHPPRVAGAKRSWLSLLLGSRQEAMPEVVEVIEIIGPQWWQRYEDRRLVAEGPNALGRLPVVHIPNIALPGLYEGLSDVEPLIPLQDELNTRLSDRANRVTYQSFKMYLGKGIDDFLDRPVGPGQMWATQNLQASIEEFGSDSGSPSEDIHIDQVRQAMDKVSGVTPLAAGLIGGAIGNLTSATALKVVLSGLLARTAKKRLSYGQGLQQLVELALAWMDLAGVLKTSPQDRAIEIHWPNPLPVDEGEQLRNAQINAQLGVPLNRVLMELGYDRPTAETAAE